MSRGNLKNYELPKKKESQDAAALVQREMRFQTHLLPPQLLREYNEIIPTFADDIHREFIKEGKHRRSNNNWLIRGAIGSKFFGQISALAIALFVLYIAWDLGKNGQPYLAGFLGGLDLVALVSVFLGVQYFGKNQEPIEEEE